MSRSPLAFYISTAAIVAGVAILQCAVQPNADVAWLLTVAERYLAGARPDIDFIEFNPPAAYLIYVPVVAVSRVIGLSSDVLLVAMMVTVTAASVWLSSSILTRAGLMQSWERPAMAAACALALLAFADNSFAQREHIGLVAMLPMLAIYAARANETAPRRTDTILSGLAGGIALCIKPYFALALIVPLLYVLWRARRNARELLGVLLATENISAAAVVIIYVVGILSLFPDYFRRTLPIVLTVYLPNREPLFRLLTGIRFGTFVLMAGAAFAVGGRDTARPVAAIACLASLGFLIAMFVQARIWFYQGYPALALLMLLTCWLMIQRGRRMAFQDARGRLVSWAIIAASAIPSVATLVATHSPWFTESSNDLALAESVRSLAPGHPKVIGISEERAFVTIPRAVRGTWVGRTYFEIIDLNVDQRTAMGGVDGATKPRLEAYAKYERHVLAEDIETKLPDVILIDGAKYRRWAFADPRIALALRRYHQAGQSGRILIWTRNAS